MKNFHLLVVVLFSIGITLNSCAKENRTITYEPHDLSNSTIDQEPSVVSSCNGELEWLDDMIANIIENKNDMIKYEYIMMAQFEGDTVFYYRNCDPYISYCSQVLNCKGERIKPVHQIEDDLTDSVVYWKPDESECNI